MMINIRLLCYYIYLDDVKSVEGFFTKSENLFFPMKIHVHLFDSLLKIQTSTNLSTMANCSVLGCK